MRVAVFGSRQGYDLNHLGSWLHALWQKQGPTTELVSGGADGVDTYAEQTWIAFGGSVTSFRPIKVNAWDQEDEYAIECWKLGAQPKMVFRMEDHPTFADFSSAASYRDMLIIEGCDKGVAFWNGQSRGTAFTIEHGRNIGKEVYVYGAEAEAHV